jgi:hypothetical protein
MDTKGDCLEQLDNQYPCVPFLALGQTVLWDEPTKATLFLRGSRRPFIAGVHDTDYFAKLPGHPAAARNTPFVQVAHDDITTRGLWSAAGEMSRFFGSEDVPTREKLTREGGVNLARLTQDEQRQLTTAWGWSGLIETGWEKSIVAEIPLRAIQDALVSQVAWAVESTELQGTLCDQVSQYAEAHPTATLPDLYEALLPRFYAMLLGQTPAELSTTRTTQLLQFNTQTATLPRFAFVESFLALKTRSVAKDAYNLAVQGSDIYPLDHFGEDALPFDLFVPGKGRGTISLTPGGTLTIDATEKITLRGKPILSITALAARIEEALGTNCVLIGKAVTLIPMLAAEYIFTMHEGASGYTGRTNAMLSYLRQKGVALPPIYPILRLKYDTWTALSAVQTTINLPPFLVQATGRNTIATDDFAACWRERVQDEKQLLRELSRAQKPRDLMRLLRDADSEQSYASEQEYASATQTLLKLRQEGEELHEQRHALYAEIRTLKARYNALQHQRGTDFRTRVFPLTPSDVAAREQQFTVPMSRLREQIQGLEMKARTLKNQQHALEKSDAADAAHAALRDIERQIERKRATLAQNALQTIYGLPHTSYRPSFWWFLQLDPSGNWLRRTAETAKLSLEVL